MYEIFILFEYGDILIIRYCLNLFFHTHCTNVLIIWRKVDIELALFVAGSKEDVSLPDYSV